MRTQFFEPYPEEAIASMIQHCKNKGWTDEDIDEYSPYAAQIYIASSTSLREAFDHVHHARLLLGPLLIVHGIPFKAAADFIVEVKRRGYGEEQMKLFLTLARRRIMLQENGFAICFDDIWSDYMNRSRNDSE